MLRRPRMVRLLQALPVDCIIYPRERPMANEDTVSILNTLLETCRDGDKGFRNAAENANGLSIQTQFREFARERADFANELSREVERLGGTPASGGSASGALHRGWMDVKGAVTSSDDSSLVAEAERGEDVAVATYRRALQQDLPAEIKSLIERQARRVKAVHDTVRTMERQQRT
jgi:uncharacterized protein (TIGR02284 family)